MMRTLLIVVCALLLPQVLHYGPAAAQPTRIIQIGVVGLASDLPIYLAETRGYFKAEGLGVNLVSFVSGAKMIASLGSGELDVAGGASSAALYNAILRGVELRIVADKGSIAPRYGYKALIVRADLSPKFKSFADLKGMRVGIVAAGAADESVLHQALLRGKLADGDVERVYLSFSQQIIAMQNNGIDAAIAAEPDITMMLRLKTATRFAGLDEFYPGQQTAQLLYGGNFTKEHDLGLRFMRAYLRGVRDYVSTLHDGKISGPGAEAILQQVNAMTGMKDPTIFRDAVPPFMNPDGHVNKASLQMDLDYFELKGVVPKGFKLETALDESFAREAAATLPPFTASP